MWQQVNEVYVKDKYNMDLKEFFEKNSPHALQAITARIMEVDRKGYQKFGLGSNFAHLTLVPTLCVGILGLMRSHAERGNERQNGISPF
jgi:cobalamin biosynthesis Mg chelatase CobN